MGSTLTYGVFAVAEENLGDNEIFNGKGEVAHGAVSVEVSQHGMAAFEISITGFIGGYEDKSLAMGAYVAVTKNGATEYSYM